MIKLNKILYPTDFSRCANQAFSRALDLAKRYEAELHMYHVIPFDENDPLIATLYVPHEETIYPQLEKNATVDMNHVIKSYQAEGLGVKKVLQKGKAIAPTIIQYADKNDIDLIVMGTHGRSSPLRFLLGSVTEKIVQAAHCPVLSMPEQKEPKHLQPLKSVLVPIDFSIHSQKALIYAKEIAAITGAKLQLLHVIEDSILPAFYFSGGASFFERIPDIKNASRRTMEQILNEMKGSKVETELHVTEGRAAKSIVEFATNHKSDLIVIATHGLTGYEHFLLGSVTEKVVRLSPQPVLTVKAFGKSLLEE